MKELKHLGDACQEKVLAIERVANAFINVLIPGEGSDGPLSDGVDEWDRGWMSDDVVRVWATRGDERLDVIICPSAYEGYAAEVVVSLSSTECDMQLDSWLLAVFVAELRRQGLEGEIGYADCMEGTLAVALPERVDS